MRCKRLTFKRPVRPLRLRIRTYLLFLMLGAAMPFVLLSAILAVRTAGAQDKRFGQDAVAVARALSLAVDSSIVPLQSALEALGRSPALARGDLPAFHAELANAAALLGGIVLLSDADGQGLLDSRDPSGVRRTERRASPAYVAAVAAGSRPMVSGIYRSTINGQMVVTVDVPVRFPSMRFPGPDGPNGTPGGAPGSTPGGASVPGVLGTTIDLGAIDALVRRQLLPDTWRGGIIDRDGHYVQRTKDGAASLGSPAHPAWTEAARRATEGWTHSPMPEGMEGYIAFATSPVTGWTVGIGVPAAVVRAPLRQTLLSLLALSAGFAGLGVALALALARRIARPVDALARLAANPDGAPAAGSSGVVEIDAVARALRHSSAARGAIEAEMRAATSPSISFPLPTVDG